MMSTLVCASTQSCIVHWSLDHLANLQHLIQGVHAQERGGNRKLASAAQVSQRLMHLSQILVGSITIQHLHAVTRSSPLSVPCIEIDGLLGTERSPGKVVHVS